MARGLAQKLVTQARLTSVDRLKGVSWAPDGFVTLRPPHGAAAGPGAGYRGILHRLAAVSPPPELIDRLLAYTIDVSLIRVEEAIA